MNDLGNHQTLDGFIQDSQLKLKSQQISHDKNIQAALTLRKAQILDSKSKKNKLTNVLNINLSNTSQSYIQLPKIQSSKNQSFVKQSMGFASHRESTLIDDSLRSTPKNDKIISQIQISNSLEALNSKSLLGLNSNRNSLIDQKLKNNVLNQNSPNNSENKSLYFLSRKEHPLNLTCKTERQNPQLNQLNSLSQNIKNISYFHNAENGNNESKEQKFTSAYDHSLHLDSQKTNEGYKESDSQKNTPSRRLKSQTINQGKPCLPAIRKEDSEKKNEKFSIQKNLDELFYQNQKKLVDLNTRSLDLQEISNELLKIYAQKHSQSQVKQSLQNITSARLLSMSSTLRKGSNNSRLFKLQSGLIQENQSQNEQTKLQAALSIYNEGSNQNTPKQKYIGSERSISRPPADFISSISQSQTPKNSEQSLKRYKSVEESDYFNGVDSPKEIRSAFKKEHKNDIQMFPMSTTMQYRYFKKQVGFLENQETYIEEIKKSNGDSMKISQILDQQSQQCDETLVTSKKNIFQSESFLNGEMYNNSSGTIKDLNLQRTKSSTVSGYINSQFNSSYQIELPSLCQKKDNSEQIDNTSILKNSQSLHQLSHRQEFKDEQDENLSQLVDQLNESNLQKPYFLRSKESGGLTPLLRKQSQFYKNNESGTQQQQSPLSLQKISSQQTFKKQLSIKSPSQKIISSLNQSPKNDQINEQEKNMNKSNNNSFKLEQNQQFIDEPSINYNLQQNLDEIKEKQNTQMLNQIKKQQQPILAKLLCSIQDQKKDKNEEMLYLSKSINNNQPLVGYNDSYFNSYTLNTSPKAQVDKYQNSFNNMKGDQKHYQKILEQNYQQKALFKQAKLRDKNSFLKKKDKSKTNDSSPVMNVCLQIQQKNIVQQKQPNS